MPYLFFILFSATLFGQQYNNVDFTSVSGKLEINAENKQVSGKVIYEFEVLKMVDTIYIDAQNMTFDNVFVNDNKTDFIYSEKKIGFYKNYNLGKNILTFDYKAKPKQAIYFNNFNDNWQIWTQGQGKYTSNWFPSFDDVNEKLIFNLSISFDQNYKVVSNGTLKSKTLIDNKNLWQYTMDQPMSSYLLMLAIGKYDIKTIKSLSGIPLELYIEPEDNFKFESTFRYSKEIFDFFEKEIGVKYPWKIYKQVPVRDFLYAGMENTSATIFSRDFVIDSTAFNDRNYIDVNAHELAHQWFGDLITAKSGKDHWLQEGFATYYALLAEKKILGENYFYNTLYNFTQEFKNSEKTDATPVLYEKASSLTFYKKGAFALFVLENQIGKKNFRKAVQNYLIKYSFKNVTTDDFLNEIKKVCNFDTAKFSKEWLESDKFNYLLAKQLLSKNKMIAKLLKLKNLREKAFINKEKLFAEILKSDDYYAVKQEVLLQIRELSYKEKAKLVNIAVNDNNLLVRQFLAVTTFEIDKDFKLKFESLLDDKSYETKEIVLINLITNYPKDSSKYLNRTKNISGFNDKGFEMLWTFFALITPNYSQNPNELIDKIISYSNNSYEFSIRKNAFTYLRKLDKLNDIVLENLIDCCFLPNWRSAKWSKDFLQEILKYEKIKNQYLQLLPNLSLEKQNLLKRFLL